jgi:hypothetical protein
MANLIESLIGGAVERYDDRRLSVTKRPPPTKPREFFEIFALMGATASPEGLMRGIDWKHVDPCMLTFAVLGRWPTSQELAELQVPYRPYVHLRHLLGSEEFRTAIVRRLFEVFPERQRLLFVRIPRCAGTSVMSVLDTKHPILPLDLGDRPFREAPVLVPLLGQLLGRFGTTRTLVVAQPRIGPFVEAPTVTPACGDPLHWHLPQPPCRGTDLLFTIIRPPEALILSEVNGILTALRRPASPGEPASLAEQRKHHAPLPDQTDSAGWKQLGRKLLAATTLRNPICTALGDGTAAGAFAACARVPIQLVAIEAYRQWSRAAFDSSPADPVNVSTPILQPADLTAEDSAHLSSLIAEDAVFYARYAERRQAEQIPYVLGTDLKPQIEAKV